MATDMYGSVCNIAYKKHKMEWCQSETNFKTHDKVLICVIALYNGHFRFFRIYILENVLSNIIKLNPMISP